MPVPTELLMHPAYIAASPMEIGAWVMLAAWADLTHKETFDTETAYSTVKVSPEGGPALFASMAARGFVTLEKQGRKVRVVPPERFIWGTWREDRAKAKAESSLAREGAPTKPGAPTHETGRTYETQTQTGAPGRSPLGAHHTELQTPAPAPAPTPEVRSEVPSGVWSVAYLEAIEKGMNAEQASRLADSAEIAHKSQGPGLVLPFPTPSAKPQEND